MDRQQQKEYDAMFHPWSAHVYSLDVAKIPEDIRMEIGISESDFRKAKEAFYCRIKEGVILINESMEGWKIRKDLFLALDALPNSLLRDIYEMEYERYKGESPDFDEIEEPGEKIRKLLYFCYIPDLIQAHKESNKKHI